MPKVTLNSTITPLLNRINNKLKETKPNIVLRVLSDSVKIPVEYTIIQTNIKTNMSKILYIGGIREIHAYLLGVSEILFQ